MKWQVFPWKFFYCWRSFDGVQNALIFPIFCQLQFGERGGCTGGSFWKWPGGLGDWNRPHNRARNQWSCYGCFAWITTRVSEKILSLGNCWFLSWSMGLSCCWQSDWKIINQNWGVLTCTNGFSSCGQVSCDALSCGAPGQTASPEQTSLNYSTFEAPVRIRQLRLKENLGESPFITIEFVGQEEEFPCKTFLARDRVRFPFEYQQRMRGFSKWDNSLQGAFQRASGTTEFIWAQNYLCKVSIMAKWEREIFAIRDWLSLRIRRNWRFFGVRNKRFSGSIKSVKTSEQLFFELRMS